MFQPKPATHLCDLVEEESRLQPVGVRDAIAVDCELMNQDRHSLAQSHFQINS
jgi:hypothetical protein